MLTDYKGKVKESYAYDAFGVAYEGDFQRVNEYGYNGKRYDPAVALYDYGFRDLKPQLGRFITLDPIKDSFNWYVYVNNDPINFIDPLGLSGTDKDGALTREEVLEELSQYKSTDYTSIKSEYDYYIDEYSFSRTYVGSKVDYHSGMNKVRYDTSSYTRERYPTEGSEKYNESYPRGGEPIEVKAEVTVYTETSEGKIKTTEFDSEKQGSSFGKSESSLGLEYSIPEEESFVGVKADVTVQAGDSEFQTIIAATSQ